MFFFYVVVVVVVVVAVVVGSFFVSFLFFVVNGRKFHTQRLAVVTQRAHLRKLNPIENPVTPKIN